MSFIRSSETDVPSKRFGRSILPFLAASALIALGLLSTRCGPNDLCTQEVSSEVVDPVGRPCRRSCECNNQAYEGACLDGTCRSIRRAPCTVPGSVQVCVPFLRECDEGRQKCHPAYLTEQLWGNCLCSTVVPDETRESPTDTLPKDTKEVSQGEDVPDASGLEAESRPELPGTKPEDEASDASEAPPESFHNERVPEQPPEGPCKTGETRPCYASPLGCMYTTSGLQCRGTCSPGTQRCSQGKWLPCKGFVVPRPETCDGKDNNCNGKVDEGCKLCLPTSPVPLAIQSALFQSNLNTLAYGPKGRYLAVVESNSFVIRLLDPQTGTLKKTLGLSTSQHPTHKHEARVSSLAFSADGVFLVSGSWDHTVRVWDVTTGLMLQRFGSYRNKAHAVGHTSFVTQVAIHPKGNWIASAGQDRTIRVWERQSGKLLNIIPPGGTRVQGKTCANDSQCQQRRGEFCYNQQCWVPAISKGHIRQVESLAFSPDGRWLASGSSDARTMVWDTSTWKLSRSLGEGRLVDFSRPCSSKADCSGSSELCVLDCGAPTACKVSTKFCARLDPKRGPRRVSKIVFSPDSTTLASVGSGLYLWDVGSGKLKLPPLSNVNDAAFRPDGKAMAAIYARRVWVLDVGTGKTLQTLSIPTSVFFEQVAYHPKGGSLTVFSKERLSAWNLTTNKLLFALSKNDATKVTMMELQQNTSTLFLALGLRLQLYDATNGTLKKESTLCLYPQYLHAAQSILVGLSEDRNDVVVWDSKAEKEVRRFGSSRVKVPNTACLSSADCDSSQGEYCDQRECWKRDGKLGHIQSFELKAHSPSGSLVLTASPHTVRIWNYQTGKQVFSTGATTTVVPNITCTNNGQCKAIRNGFCYANRCHIPDLSTYMLYDCRNEFDCTRFALSANEKILAIAKRDLVQLWDVASGKLLHRLGPGGQLVAKSSCFHDTMCNSQKGEFCRWGQCYRPDRSKGHPSNSFIRDLSFDPTGTLFASTDGRSIKVWDVRTGKLLRSLGPGGSVIPNASCQSSVAACCAQVAQGTSAFCYAGDCWKEDTTKGSYGMDFLVFHPTQSWLVTSGQTLFWDYQKGTLLRKTTLGGVPTSSTCSTTCNGRSCSKDEFCYSAKCFKYDLTAGHAKGSVGLGMPADGRFLVSTGEDRTIRFWNPKDGTLLHTLTPNLSPIQKTSCYDKSCLLSQGLHYCVNHQCYEKGQGSGHLDEIKTFKLSPDGKILLAVAGTTKSTLYLWRCVP